MSHAGASDAAAADANADTDANADADADANTDAYAGTDADTDPDAGNNGAACAGLNFAEKKQSEAASGRAAQCVCGSFRSS